MQPKKKTVKFRGISNTIRRGIARGELVGIISERDVRDLLHGKTSKAPNSVIRGSMSHLARSNELIKDSGIFQVPGTGAEKPATPKAKVRGAVVSGSLISVTKDSESGKMVATVEIEDLRFK